MTRRIHVQAAAVPLSFTGDAGNNVFIGDSGNDRFFLQQGGDDTAIGNDGNDGFFFGGALTALDTVNGGAGADTLALQGNYAAGMTLGNVTQVDVLLLASGADTQFGDTANNRYSYRIATQDGNVAAGQMLTVQAAGLLAGENLVFDGSAESDAGFRVFAGQGIDTLKGGAGSDGFFFGGDQRLTGADRIDGGGGIDSIALRGDYFYGGNQLVLQDASFTNIEVFVFLSAHSNAYGGVISPVGFNYAVFAAEGNVAAGQRLDVIATALGADESAQFDGSLEHDGSFRMIGGAGHDVFFGGYGDDLLYGRGGDDWLVSTGGVDLLDGGAGSDLLILYDNLNAADRVDGGDGLDWLWLGGRHYSDGDFAGVSRVENLSITGSNNHYQLGPIAQASGITDIRDISNSANTIDASGYSGYGAMQIAGGFGGDLLTGGTGGQNIYIYDQVTDSQGMARDTILNFHSGVDVIDAHRIEDHPELAGYTINFVGSFASEAAAQAALPSEANLLNAVFVTATNTLWFDIDGDHVLGSNDLAIGLNGVSFLQSQDVMSGTVVIS